MRTIAVFETLSIKTSLLNHKFLRSFAFGFNWLKIKSKILKKDYDLSIVFIGKKRSQKLNSLYRKKNYEPDVLSFPISKSQGEIFINPYISKKKSRGFGMSAEKYLFFLVIHGMLHLNGMAHGAKMEQAEQKYLRDFEKK